MTAYPSAPYNRLVLSRTCACVAMNCATALMKKTRSDSLFGNEKDKGKRKMACRRKRKEREKEAKRKREI